MRIHAARQKESLLDHLISAGEQFRWRRDAESLGGLQVDGQLSGLRETRIAFARRLYNDIVGRWGVYA
jgi:hypothetical protein